MWELPHERGMFQQVSVKKSPSCTQIQIDYADSGKPYSWCGEHMAWQFYSQLPNGTACGQSSFPKGCRSHIRSEQLPNRCRTCGYPYSEEVPKRCRIVHSGKNILENNARYCLQSGTTVSHIFRKSVGVEQGVFQNQYPKHAEPVGFCRTRWKMARRRTSPPNDFLCSLGKFSTLGALFSARTLTVVVKGKHRAKSWGVRKQIPAHLCCRFFGRPR